MVLVAPHSIKSFFIVPVMNEAATAAEDEEPRGPRNTLHPIGGGE